MAGIALWRTLVRDDVLRELTYTAREFTGEDAVRLGFATRTADDPHAQALALAREIATRNPDAVQAAKRLYNGYSNDAEALLMAESIEQAGVIRTPNQIEAVRANVEKRAPVFRDQT
jgi:enoyl-CoA hydratase/carnithine racemase